MAEWPTVTDVAKWIRQEGGSVESQTALDEAFEAADELVRDRISAAAILDKATAAGIDVDTPETIAAWCPSYVRLAIIIRSAALFTRKDSANGTIAYGEFATKVARMDPDVDELLAPVMSVGIP